jgi:hypothetical protein
LCWGRGAKGSRALVHGARLRALRAGAARGRGLCSGPAQRHGDPLRLPARRGVGRVGVPAGRPIRRAHRRPARAHLLRAETACFASCCPVAFGCCSSRK